MYRFAFELGAFGRSGNDEQLAWVLAAACEVLIRTNLLWLASFPRTPTLYTSGVRYKAEPPNKDRWRDIPTVMDRRRGDCEDLACWRIAELRSQGYGASPIIEIWPLADGRTEFHFLVERADGVTEDPSAMLGMLT